jgi:hypothetical protein
MNFTARFALILLAAASLGMSSKPKVTVRFHSEANKNDGSSFAVPVKLAYAQREAFLKRIPEFSERNIKAIFPWKTADGSWGCAFKLNDSGRIRLNTMSDLDRGSALVVFIGTKAGMHQVIDMVIDRSVTDGIISVPRGITDIEMLVLKSQFPVLGEDKDKKKPEAKPQDPTDWRIDRNRDTNTAPARAPKLPPLPAEAPRRTKRSAPEPDLPRLAD